MKTIAFACLVCGLAPLLGAQEPSPAASPTPPSGPLLERAPTFSQWTITSKIATLGEDDKPPAAKTSPSPAEPGATLSPSGKGHRTGKQPKTEAPSPETAQTTAVTKTLSIRYENITAKAGEDVKRWCFPDIQVTILGNGAPVISLPNRSDTSDYIDYSGTDFDGFQWISERNFKGVETVNDQECYTFRDKVSGSGGPPDVPTERVACINTATRLPVTLRLADELRTYQFGLAPTAVLKPPAEVISQVEQWRKSVQQSALMPAKP